MRVTVAVLVGLLFASQSLAQGKRPPVPAPVAAQAADACAVARGVVRQEAYGYTHVVSLQNGCDRPVECAVWTDVDADTRTTVQARPGETLEVITRRGSPAREVTAFKRCTYR